MQVGWIQWGGAAAVAVALLAGASLKAADDGAVVQVADELDKRTKPADSTEGQAGGMNESSIRVLMTYAFSILPKEHPGPDGKPIKVDKSDPNKFIIPTDDARRVIRAATRSAYAEVCELPELERANYQTLMKGEEARGVWSQDQLMMINALHMFSASYFAGNVKITAGEIVEEDGSSADSGARTVSESDAPAQAADPDVVETEVIAPKRPKCPPEQKQKVESAINAYVKAAEATPPPGASQGASADSAN